MRIVDIRETAIPLKSTLANSSIDFSEMTTSVVAVITDVVRNGKPVCGFAFNSTGRYACGAQMRARFIPRILAADPASLLDASGGNLDGTKIFACMMRREKAGGHSERSIAIGTIEVAVWDAVAKIADKPLRVLLAERFNGGKIPDKVFCYVGGGWYWPGQTIRDLQDEMRRHLGAGYTMVKMKVGGLPLDEDLRRLEAVLEVVGSGAHLAVDANCKFDRVEALRYAKALAPFKLRWFEEPCDPLDFGLFAELAKSYEPPQAYGIGQYAKTLDMLAEHSWPRSAMFPHGGNQMSLAMAAGFGLGGAESYPGVFGDFGGFADDARIDGGMISLSDRPGIGFEGQQRLFRIMRGLAGL